MNLDELLERHSDRNSGIHRRHDDFMEGLAAVTVPVGDRMLALGRRALARLHEKFLLPPEIILPVDIAQEELAAAGRRYCNARNYGFVMPKPTDLPKDILYATDITMLEDGNYQFEMQRRPNEHNVVKGARVTTIVLGAENVQFTEDGQPVHFADPGASLRMMDATRSLEAQLVMATRPDGA